MQSGSEVQIRNHTIPYFRGAAFHMYLVKVNWMGGNFELENLTPAPVVELFSCIPTAFDT